MNTAMTKYITIFDEVIDHVSGLLQYRVRIARDSRDKKPKYKLQLNDRLSAISLAHQMHKDRKTANIVFITNNNI